MESLKVLKKDFISIDSAPLLQKNKIYGGTVVPAGQSEAEADFVLECIKDDSINQNHG
ncbi:hypothetical protein [Flagellimonas marina]|uniref:Uncharacterized protein n=1 Tax=Flagellimonas marina TaxID=1775168 RepID=A0ABV8PME9_9FLAO